MSAVRSFRSFFAKATSRRSNRRSFAGTSLAVREVRVESLEDRKLLTVTPTITVRPIYLTSGTVLENRMIEATATATVDGVTVDVPGTFKFHVGLETPPKGFNYVAFNPTDSTTYASVVTTVPVTILSPPDLATTRPQILGPVSAVLTGVVDPGNNPAETFFQFTAGYGFTPSEPSTIASGFTNPSAITVDMLGDVYVAETGNDAIRMIPADGSAIKTLGSGFKAPTNVAVDAAGNVFVNDAGNGVIKKIFRDGTIITLPSGSVLPAVSLSDPAGNTYELDKTNGSVRKLAVPSISMGTLSHQNDPISLTHTLNGLTPGAAYSYRLVARNNDGFAVGDTFSFVAGQSPDSLNDNFSIGGGGGGIYLNQSILPLASTPIILGGRPALAIAGPGTNQSGLPSLSFISANPSDYTLILRPDFSPIAFNENAWAISDMTSADFNGDGFSDIAITGDYLNVFLSNKGLFNSLPLQLPVSSGQTGRVAAGDLNGDGKPEILVTGTAGGFDVFKNKGDGTFFSAVHIAGPGVSTSVSIVDINRDGKPDLITADAGTNSVGIYIGKGDATFHPRIAVGLTADAFDIAIGDLNGDQFLDLVVTNSSAKSITLMKNNGDGSFASVATFPVGVNPFEIKLGDINGDGTQDLVVANRGTVDGGGSVSLLFGLGDFEFAPEVSLGYQFDQNDGRVTSVSDVPLIGMQLIDFMQTGRPEIVMLSATTGIATVTYNGPKFFDAPITPIGIGLEVTDGALMEAADVNSDGLLDVIANSNATLVLYVNLGQGRFRKQLLLRAVYEPTGFLVTDLNGDGHQDIVYSSFNNSYSLINDGNGTFIDGSFYIGIADLDSLDINSDGLLDLVGKSYDLTAMAFLNHGGGVFGTNYNGPEFPVYNYDYTPSLLSGEYRALGDLNNDGINDIVWTGKRVGINLSDGQGGYTSSILPELDSGKMAPLIADLNNDGSLDLAIRGASDRNLLVYHNHGDGTFGSPLRFSFRSGITSMASGDFNGDGLMDIAITRQNPIVRGLDENPMVATSRSLVLLTGDGQGSFVVRDAGNIAGSAPIVSGRFDASGNDTLFTPYGLLTMITPEITLDQVNLPRQVAAGTSVGDITASTTGLGDITYSLVSGEGDTDNALFSLDSNGHLTTTASLDASVKSSYSIRVRSIDSVGVIGEQVLSVVLKSVSLTNVVSTLQDTTSTTARTRVADVGISAVSSSANTLSLSGPDASSFEISDGQLFLKAGVKLSVAKLSYNVTVNLDDPALTGSPDASANYTLNITSFIPTNLSVSTPTFDMTPTVTWSPGINAVRYEVYLRNQATEAIIRETVTEATWTPSADLGIGRFTFWVRSINAAGVKSTWSLSTAFTVNTPVTVPTQTLSPSARPTVTWAPLLGAVSYEIWLSDSTRKVYPLLRESGITATSWTPSNDLALGRYVFWVRGIDASGRVAAWSAALPFMVQNAPVPSSLFASTFSRQPTLSWSAPVSSASFVLYMANQTTGATQTISGIPGTSWTPSSNLADGRWTWRVRAISDFGLLTYWSQSAQLYVGGQTVVAVPSVNSGSPVTFDWSAVSGAASYTLWLHRIDVPQVILRTDGLTTSSLTTSTALAAGTYRVWVRAVSSTGEISSWSRLVEFIVASNDVDSSLSDEPLVVRLDLSVLPTSHELSVEDSSQSYDTQFSSADRPAAIVLNDGSAEDPLSTTPDSMGHPTVLLADSSVQLPVAAPNNVWDVFGQLDESELHELLHCL